MNVEYKRDLQNNYMILEADQGTEEDGYRIRMAEQNEIQGLLPFYSGKKDGKLYLHYEITSKQSIENLYARSMLGYQDILFLLNGISETLDTIQKYLLSPSQLLFDPQFIFVYPDKSKLFLCYCPGDNVSSLIELAEFILKRLNHEDSQAVALGYQFYQRALEENFSLQKTLKEILLSMQPGISKGQKDKHVEMPSSNENRKENNKNDERRNTCRNEYGEAYNYGSFNEISNTGNKSKSEEEEVYPYDEWNEKTYNVKEDSTKQKKIGKHAILWLLDRIHPLVLLSSVILLLIVEILFMTGWINLTEAGGIFFLILSVEILINKFWKSRTKKKQSEWWEEPADLYEEFQNTVYNGDGQMHSQQEYTGKETGRQRNWTDYSDETKCLIEEEPEGIRLRCMSAAKGNDKEMIYPDIIPGSMPVYIGKMQGESDIVIDSPTVSRIHARIDHIDDMYYIRDLNSKNGTFINGERMQPQEQRRIEKGDVVSFAEVVYQVV